MSQSWESIRARKRPIVRSVALCLDSTLIDAVRDAEAARDAADAKGQRAAARRLTEAEQARDEASVTFRFRALARDEYERLVVAHPATDTDREDAEKHGDPPPEFGRSFQPALVAAAIVEPSLSADEVTEMWASADWAYGELLTLFAVANGASASSSVVDVGKGSTGTVG